MPLSDYKLWVHGKAYPTAGVALASSGNPEYSEDEINFGYADPNPAKNGNFGLHFEIMETFTVLTSGIIKIIHGSTTAPTTAAVERYFPVAELVAGKHYFIPAPPTLRRYVKACFSGSTTATAGKACLWFGPGKDGAE